MTGGFADGKALRIGGQRTSHCAFVPAVEARAHLRDIAAVLDAAEAAGLAPPLSETARGLFGDLAERGGAGVGHGALPLDLERRSASARPGDTPGRPPATGG